ncbi:MAG TPA: oligosaccharide flippase family protein [Chloroflexota bacterium]|nr:oligosaccharide flippase family protein [Chloroflexota bacterium]
MPRRTMTFARQSLGSLAALVFGVAVSVLLPRLLGAEARGEYQLVVKVAGLVLAIAQWGIPEVLLQVMAEGEARTAKLIGTSLALGIVGAAAIAAILGLAAPLFSDNLLRGVDPFLLWLTLGGSLASLLGLLARRFIQLGGRLDVYNGLDVGRTALFVSLVVVGGILLPRQALGPTVAWLLAEVALAVVALMFLARQFKAKGPWQVDTGLAMQLMGAGAPIQFGLLAMFVGSEGGIFVLNANLDVASVGVYSVALAVSRLVLQISIALRTALQPRLVTAEDDSANVTARVTRHGVLWMVLVAIGLAIGSPLAAWVFGREFQAVGPALVLLLPGMVAYGIWQLLAGHLLRIGRRGFLAAAAWLFAVTSIGLQAVGGQAFGMTGAAAGLTIAYVLAMVVVLIAFVHLSGRSARELVPVRGDLAFYVGLTRRVLATR